MSSINNDLVQRIMEHVEAIEALMGEMGPDANYGVFGAVPTAEEAQDGKQEIVVAICRGEEAEEAGKEFRRIGRKHGSRIATNCVADEKAEKDEALVDALYLLANHAIGQKVTLNTHTLYPKKGRDAPLVRFLVAVGPDAPVVEFLQEAAKEIKASGGKLADVQQTKSRREAMRLIIEECRAQGVQVGSITDREINASILILDQPGHAVITQAFGDLVAKKGEKAPDILRSERDLVDLANALIEAHNAAERREAACLHIDKGSIIVLTSEDHEDMAHVLQAVVRGEVAEVSSSSPLGKLLMGKIVQTAQEEARKVNGDEGRLH